VLIRYDPTAGLALLGPLDRDGRMAQSSLEAVRAHLSNAPVTRSRRASPTCPRPGWPESRRSFRRC